MQDPELSIDRALEQYIQLGYSENWINQRLKSIEQEHALISEKEKRSSYPSKNISSNRIAAAVSETSSTSTPTAFD